MATATTQVMVSETTWWVMKWAMARATRAIVLRSSPTLLPLSPLSLPLLLRLPCSLLVLPPQFPNAIALSAAIAVAVAITHLFDTAIKRQWCGGWQWKQWLWQQRWWASNGNNGNGNGNNTCDRNGNKVTGNKVGNGKSGKSDGHGIKEGIDDGSKSNGARDKEGKGKGGKGNCDSNKGVMQGTVMATKRAMATAMRVAGNEESAGNGDCKCDSNKGDG
jgi:hypothetical protein